MAALASLGELKAYLGSTNAADDAELQDLLDAYSKFAETYCSRVFAVTAHDIWRDGRGRSAMVLPQWPIVSVEALTVDGVAIPAQSTFGAHGYRFDRDSIILDGQSFGDGRSSVHIQFTAGYATIPDDLKQAVIETSALRYKERDRIGYSSKSLAGETISFIIRALPDSAKTTLNAYRAVVPA